MMKMFYRLALAAFMLVVIACGGEDAFTVGGQISDYPSREVQVVYMAQNGQFQCETVFTDESGKFSMTGYSSDLTAVEVFLHGSGRVALLLAKNGDKIVFKCNPATGELVVKGNDESALLGEWMTSNKNILAEHNSEGIDRSIAEFVRANPESSASVALLMTTYDMLINPLQADSLRRMIDKKAYTAPLAALGEMLDLQVGVAAKKATEYMVLKSLGDTLIQWNSVNSKVSFFAFEDNLNYADRDTLHRLNRDFKRRQMRVVEVFMVPDSAEWRRMLSSDTARWERGWHPGLTGSQALRQFLPPATPYYVVVDSAGTQLYRGVDIKAAAQTARRGIR
ncbi:MAG: hypothetical protein J1E84_02960 [Muribaculaceae bacterium]|nr:hypothetical protein [Muribaculaceae bacterium]